jgi:hypothetical protein
MVHAGCATSKRLADDEYRLVRLRGAYPGRGASTLPPLGRCLYSAVTDDRHPRDHEAMRARGAVHVSRRAHAWQNAACGRIHLEV